MRLLPLFITSALICGGCSAGAGMQATPAAPISQSAGTTEYAASPPTTTTAAEDAAADAVDAAVEDPAVSQTAAEAAIPTAAGGAFLRA